MKRTVTLAGIFILAILQSLCFQVEVIAVKANPNPTVFSQPDGSTVTLYPKGDEFIHWAETIDGYTVLMNPEGWMEYARLDNRGRLVFSGIKANDPVNRSPEALAFLQTISKGLAFNEEQVKEFKEFLKGNRAPYSALTGGFPTTGTRKLLMILANFSNTTTTNTQAQFNNYMNQVNYNSTGSFRDYYLEVSYGQLTINTTVTVWVTLPNNHDFYGPEEKWGQFAFEAITAANSQASVDFSEFDNDNDGTVEGIAIIHQGKGQEETLDPDDIWSHSWDLTQAGYSAAERTFDNVLVNDYTTQPERYGSGMTHIGVMCHEFGHNLGAPDFYDTDENTTGSTTGAYDGTGNWDLMAGGSWNNSGKTPAHPNPYIKAYIFNWSTVTTLTAPATITVSNSAENNNSFYRYMTGTANEYYLIENREQTDFDAHVPGSGMIIYHVDGTYISAHSTANDINVGSHQGFYPMAANASTASGIMLSSASTINSAGCPWPGSAHKTSFTDYTTPCSKSWAAANTNKTITNISRNATAKTVTFDFMGGVQVALVLDRSGSMDYSGYLQPAKDAAKSFVNLMQMNDYLAVTSFETSATVNFPFAQITSEQIKTNAKNAIDAIFSGNMTSIGAGMQISQGQLNLGNTNKPQGMILLSDGYENTAPYVSSVLPSIPGNTDIYTIALGPDSDQGLLNSIAANTGGFYSYSPNTQRLNLIYNTIRAKVTGQQTMAIINGLIAQGQNIIQNIILDAGSTFANFSLTWPGSDLDLTLTDPQGTVINHGVTNPNISFSSGDTYETYTIINPLPGQYSMNITGVTVTGQEPYSASVTGESNLKMDVTLNKSFYGTGEPILIRAQLTDGAAAVTGANVSANITSPTTPNSPAPGNPTQGEPAAGIQLTYQQVSDSLGQYVNGTNNVYYNYFSNSSSLTLFDDGMHGDLAAGDGIYGNYYTATTIAGSYSFDITATGTAPTSGAFTRTDSKSTIVTTTQSILVNEPQTSSTWYAQSYQTVQWSSSNISGNVNIYLSTNGGSTFPTQLAMNIPDDGNEEVFIPNVQSATCRIKVESDNTPAVYGLNPGNFSIVPCTPPVPTFTTAPGASSCTETEITYTTQPGKTDYVWAVLGTLNIDFSVVSGSLGSSSHTVTLKWLTTGNKMVIVNYSETNGCAGLIPASSSTAVYARPVPTFTAAPGSTVCAQTNITYTTQSGQSDYLWTVPGSQNTDYTIVSGGTGAGSHTVTLKWITTGSKTVTVNYTNSNGCNGVTAATSTTLVNPVPAQPSEINGNTTPCLNSSQVYSVTNVTGVTYNWTLPAGWIKTAGGTSHSITVTVGSGTGNIEVTPSNACGNGLPRILPVSPRTVPAQPGVIAGASSPCQGFSYTYSVPNVPAVSYTWSFPSGWNQTGGSTNSTATVTVGTGSGNIQVTPSNNCGSGTPRSLPVTAATIPAAPGAIAGNVSPCLNSSQTYSVPNVPGVYYTWSFPTGWTQTGGGISNSVTVTVGASNGNISVTPMNGCGNSASTGTLAVTYTTVPTQPSTITGTNSPCAGTSQVYSVTNTPGVSYNWTFPSGWTQTAGATSNQATVTVGSGSGNITVTPSNGCGNGTARNLAVSPASIPAMPGPISSGTNICIGSSVVFSVPLINGVTYAWTFPSGWGTPVIGTPSNTATVTVGTNAGDITVTPSNSCGTGPARVLNVTPQSIPSQPLPISGKANPCIGYTETYTVAAVANVTYTWTVPSGWSILSGATTNTLTVTIGSASGSITVKFTNGCGSSPQRALAVSPVSMAAQPSVITGNTSPMAGSSQTYSVVNVAGITYSWIFPSGWVQTSGSTTNLVTVTVSSSCGNVQVSPLNSCGTGPTRTLAVTPVPSSVTIQNVTVANGQNRCYAASANITVAGSGTTFTLENGGQATMTAGQKVSLLPGSNVLAGGKLQAMISSTQFCSCTGNKETLPSVPGGNDPPGALVQLVPANSGSAYRIYPNPTTGRFTIEMQGEESIENARIEIFSLQGKLIESKWLVQQRRGEFSLENQPAGLYLIRITSPVASTTARIIRQ